ncbi:hypothetical protein X975_09294, partial [Stegodyphus mimosarum]
MIAYFVGVSPSNIYVLPERKTAIANDVNAKDNEEFGKSNESGFLKKREENIHYPSSKSTLNAIPLEVHKENEITTRNHQTNFEKDGQNDVVFPNNLENVLKYVDNSHVTDKTNEETDKNLKLLDPEINNYEKSYESDEIVKGNIQIPILEQKPLITSTIKESYLSSVFDTERILLLPETLNDGVENNSPVEKKTYIFENIPTEFISEISSVECNANLQNCDLEETEQGKYNPSSFILHDTSLLSVGKISRITPLKIIKSNGKWNVSRKVSASSIISFCNKNEIISHATSFDSGYDSHVNKKKIENKKASVSDLKCSGIESEDDESVVDASSSVDYFTADELENSSYLS